MDNTRDTFRRSRVHAAALVVCLIYAAWPQTEREAALDRACDATSRAIEWTEDFIGGSPK